MLKGNRLTIKGEENMKIFRSSADFLPEVVFECNNGEDYDIEEVDSLISFLGQENTRKLLDGLALIGSKNYYFSTYED